MAPGVEPASCYWKVAGLITLICMSRCPWARYWTLNCSWCSGVSIGGATGAAALEPRGGPDAHREKSRYSWWPVHPCNSSSLKWLCMSVQARVFACSAHQCVLVFRAGLGGTKKIFAPGPITMMLHYCPDVLVGTAATTTTISAWMYELL